MQDYAWLEELLEATKDSESPVRFKFWSALYVVGAITRRKVYMRLKGILKLYPNLYVMLIADSGLGKQFPITMANRLLRATDATRTIIGRNSIEAIIEELGKVTTLENQIIIRDAEAAVISGEFSNLLINTDQALTILTELYDTDSLDIWKNTLRKGRDKLNNVYLSMLTATNMEHYSDRIQEKDVRGGFIARTMCIYERQIEDLNSLMEEGPDIEWENLSTRLKEITKLSGIMKMTPEAKEKYDEWYYPFYENPPIDKTGHVMRVRSHILKVAMILSLIESDNLVIERKHIEDAMDCCFKVFDDIRGIGKVTGKSKYRSNYALIINELIRAPKHTMPRRMIMNKHQNEFTWRELQETIETMVHGDYIEVKEIKGEVCLKLTDRCIKDLMKEKGD